MLEYFNENQASFWFALGALALIVELLVLGMSTIILFMLGIGALATGTLMYLGILGEGWLLGTACLLYTSPSPRDRTRSRMPSSA